MLSSVANMRIRGDRAVLDCDGVLVDFDRSFRRVAEVALGKKLTAIPEVYELSRRYQLSSEELNRVWAVMDDHPLGWKNMPVFEGAIEAALQLKAQGLSIHLITGIPAHLAESRLLNLALHGLEPDSIHCVGDGGCPKVEQMKKLAPVMFVDDRLKLLHESPFVPYRVWVDLGHEQNGLDPCEEIIQVRNLDQWVRQWLRVMGSAPKPIQKIQPYEDWEMEALMVWEQKIHPLRESLRPLFDRQEEGSWVAHPYRQNESQKNEQKEKEALNKNTQKKSLAKSSISMYESSSPVGTARFAGTNGGFHP